MENDKSYADYLRNAPFGLKEKSHVALVKIVPFFGFQLLREKIRVSNKARLKFKAKVRKLTRRNNPLSMYQAIQELYMLL